MKWELFKERVDLLSENLYSQRYGEVDYLRAYVSDITISDKKNHIKTTQIFDKEIIQKLEEEEKLNKVFKNLLGPEGTTATKLKNWEKYYGIECLIQNINDLIDCNSNNNEFRMSLCNLLCEIKNNSLTKVQLVETYKRIFLENKLEIYL